METASGIDRTRHSLAHLLAAAVLKEFPGAKLGIGPVIENGFYYDFELPRAIAPNDLKTFEKTMRKLIAERLPFSGKKISADEAKKIFKDQPFKLELVKELEGKGEGITIYETGNVFSDLCRGGHVDNTSEIPADAFKLDKIAGAYWRGDEKNPMLQRIYGIAFASQAELDDYLAMRAEAEKRDHKKLGSRLDLFTFSPLVGSGLPLFLPKGFVVKDELEKFIRAEKEKRGYTFVWIPHIAKTALYRKSGHLGKYDAMMPIMKDAEGEEYVLKAMNCPHHFEIYNSRPHSYKDLPFRIAENTTVYRNEKSGELYGLTRVKSITQDDTHHIVRHDQIDSEIKMILGIADEVYRIFRFNDYRVQISVRDPKHPEQYFGDNALWERSEKILIDAVGAWGQPYVIEEGEAAFYGPKIDVMVKDSIGRMWQLTTIQLDFNQPENFDMQYTNEKGEKARPAILHAAIFGSTERFMGIIIEHFAGAFPLWLAPVQVAVLPVSEKFSAYGKSVHGALMSRGIRSELNDANESLGKRIRTAEMMKIPYIVVAGEKEEKEKTVNFRSRGIEGKTTETRFDEFIEKLEAEIKEKKR